jgi:hypothetical protein
MAPTGSNQLARRSAISAIAGEASSATARAERIEAQEPVKSTEKSSQHKGRATMPIQLNRLQICRVAGLDATISSAAAPEPTVMQVISGANSPAPGAERRGHP